MTNVPNEWRVALENGFVAVSAAIVELCAPSRVTIAARDPLA